MGSASCDTRRSAGMAAGPAVGAPSRQDAMKAAKDSSSWRCLSAWFAVGAAALKMDARMSSVSGAPDGGLSCVPARAWLMAAVRCTRCPAAAHCGGHAPSAAPTARSSCSTAGRLLVVPLVPCPPASMCPVPPADRTAHVSASSWSVVCGQGASSTVSVVPGKATGGAWVLGPGSDAAPSGVCIHGCG